MPTKSANNALELGYINFDSSNNRINFGVPISSNGSSIGGEDPWVRIQANAAFDAANSVNVYGANTNNTSFFSLPIGSTAERPAAPQLGSLRYNTTNNRGEIYTTDGWVDFGFSIPTISTVSPTSYNGNVGTLFTITGSNFTTDAQIYFITNGGTEYLAGTVTYVNPQSITATTPQNFTISQEPLDVKIVQQSGSFTKIDVIDCGSFPTWTTSSGTLNTYYFANTSNLSANISLVATDVDTNDTVTFAVSSGSLPDYLSLNANTGYITGNLAQPGSTTVTSNFTVNAIDRGNNQTSRSFSIIRKWYDGSSQELAANSALSIKNLTGTTSDGVYWIQFETGNTTPFQVYCHMSSLSSGTDTSGGYILAAVVTNYESTNPFLYWYNGDTSRAATSSSPNWFTADYTNNLNLSAGASTSLLGPVQKINYRGPAFTSYNFTDLLICEDISGLASLRKKAYRLDTTRTLRGWFNDVADHTSYTNRVSSILGTTGTSGTGAIRSNTIDFNYYLTNDGARLATTSVSVESTGGWCGRVDTGAGTTNYGWQGNLTRDDDARAYGSDGRTSDFTWFVFLR